MRPWSRSRSIRWGVAAGGAAALVLILAGTLSRRPSPVTGPIVRRAPVSGPAAAIVQGALLQVREGAVYTKGYVRIAYPNGDLDRSRGVCTDVVIRSLRNAGYDLQRLIHEDMRKRFATYPRRERRPDANIDHRRCPNQAWYFRRYGQTLPNDRDWRPGDIIYWKLPGNHDHAGVLSNRLNAQGQPYVIHNLGRCSEEDILTVWPVASHFRFPKGLPPAHREHAFQGLRQHRTA